MTIKKTAKRIGIGIATVALAGTAFAGSAHAEGVSTKGDVSSKAASDCPSGWLCVWAGDDYNGQMQKVEGNNADLSRYTVFKHSRSGFNNGKSCDVKLYGGTNYTDYIATVERGHKGSGTGTEVKILSNKWVNCS